MTQGEVAQIVLEILAQRADVDPSAITLETPLASIGIDSLGVVETIFEIEDRFGIAIPDSERAEDRFNDFKTPATVVRLITSLLEQRDRPA